MKTMMRNIYTGGLLLLAGTAFGALWLDDSVPTGSGGYPANASVYGKGPAIFGESGNWLINTAVYKAGGSESALTYHGLPVTLAADSGTGAYVASHENSTATSDTRYQARKLSSVPGNTTVYFSALMAYENAQTFEKFGVGLWSGLGLSASSGTTGLDSDGFWFAFRKLTLYGITKVRLVAYAGTATQNAPIVLEDNPQPGVTYMVVARVVCSDAGNETVSFALNPVSGQEVFPHTVSADILPSGQFNYLKFGGGYAFNNSAVFFDRIRAGSSFHDVAGEPTEDSVFSGPVAATGSGETVTVSGHFSFYSAASDIRLLLGTKPGVWSITNVVPSVNPDRTFSVVPSGIVPDTTYYYDAMTENASGTVSFSGATPPTLMLGDIRFANASVSVHENNAAGVAIAVQRADSAANAPLQINYSIEDVTAVAGTDYEAHASGSITIVEGESTGHITIVPIVNHRKTTDTTLKIRLESGAYLPGDQTECVVSILNSPPPEGMSVWVGEGAWHRAENWYPERMPGETDTVLLGRYSVGNMTIPAEVPMVVAGWIQEADYTGEVSVNAPFDAKDAHLKIVGDCVLEGGMWTHVKGASAETAKLFVEVGGDMTIGEPASVDVFAKGFTGTVGAGYPGTSTGSAHAGESAYAGGKTYGSVFAPILYGSSGADNETGGGVIRLTVGGTLMLDGHIIANGSMRASGGSIWINTGRLAGNGSIAADGGINSGSGGRIAVIAGHIDDTIRYSVTSGKGHLANDVPEGGPGSIYLQSSDRISGAGTVTVTRPFNLSHGASFERRSLRIPAELNNADDFTNTDFIVSENGSLKLGADVMINSLFIDTRTEDVRSLPALRLDGKTLTVKTLTIGDTVYPAGTYFAASLGDHVIDAGAQGRVIVLPQGPFTIFK